MRLELEHVTADYAGTVALRAIDLVVPSGSVVALLGPNGAGKTTTLAVSSGLLQPSRGCVRLDGVSVRGGPERFVHRGLCHVTEGRSVFAGLTVQENLRLFAEPGREAEALERAISAFPKLGQRASQLVGTMSGGEQQMVALARVYGRDARIVLLDEVSMGLAPVVLDEIFEFLRRLAEEGVSLLLVEQYVSRALAIADYVYLLNRGRVVFAGEIAEARSVDLFATYLGADGALQRA